MMDTYTVSVLLIALISLWLLYRYLVEPYNYWKRRGIPSPPAVPIFGSVLHTISEVIHDMDLKRLKEYGHIYGIYELRKPMLMVSDPRLVRDVLVKDFQQFPGPRVFPTTDPISANMLFLLKGNNWKRVRSIVSPVFSTGKIRKMFSIIKDSSQTLAQNFLKAAEKGESINVKEYFGAFTMDAIASTAFGTKIDSHNDPKNIFVKHARSIFPNGPNWRFIIAAFLPSVMEFFNIAVFDPAAIKFFKLVTLQIIKERKLTGKKRNDFLQLLLDAEQTDESPADEEQDDVDDEKYIRLIDDKVNDGQESRRLHNKSLNHDELVANCVLFFLGGFDTTATTLALAAYNLALHPEWQEKVLQEVDEGLKKNEGELSYETVQEMNILDMVVSETLRLHPPVVRTERKCAEPYKLGDTGLVIPKDMMVGIPVYAIHHDQNNYPNPEEFNPNRFTSEKKTKRDSFTYLPFGGGPRGCVAMRFAVMEVKICLAMTLSRFRFKKALETKVPLEFHFGQGLLQPKEVRLLVEERKELHAN